MGTKTSLSPPPPPPCVAVCCLYVYISAHPVHIPVSSSISLFPYFSPFLHLCPLFPNVYVGLPCPHLSLTCSPWREVTPIIPRSGSTARPCSCTAGPGIVSCPTAAVLGGHGVHKRLLAVRGGGLRGQFSLSRCAGCGRGVEAAAREGSRCLAGSVAACRRLPPAVGGHKTSDVEQDHCHTPTPTDPQGKRHLILVQSVWGPD